MLINQNIFGYRPLLSNTGYLLAAFILLLHFSQITEAAGQRINNERKIVFSSVYTNLAIECRSGLKPEEEKEAAEQGRDTPAVCKGYGGYEIFVGSHGSFTQFQVRVKTSETEKSVVLTEQLDVDDPILKRKVEWRLADGKPFAVILRRDADSEPGDESARKKSAEVLRVIGLIDKEIDFTIDAKKIRKENQEARELADLSFSLEVTTKINRKKYRADVSRSFANPEEERLLNIAESVYPDPDKRKKDCPHPGSTLPEAGWACGSFDGFLTPFAVTKGTIIYYLKTTHDFRKGRQRGFRMQDSSLKYSSKIEYQPDYQMENKKFTDVYVVSMDFDWSHVCGSLCGLYLKMDRTVVLNKDGEVLFIKGDQKPVVIVS